MGRTVRVAATLMRGGTSKCWVFDAAAIAALPVDADSVLLAAFGAADPRQIDGVGGATSTTSKALLIRSAQRPDADIEYTFAQVGIGSATVEWASDCGNCATAAGLYALQAGLVPVRGERSTVRLRNTNTGARLNTTVATPGGVVPEIGTASVPGARGGGVGVDLTFRAPFGRGTGALLPTGASADEVLGLPATLVDAGAPAALFSAAALGLTGAESIAEFGTRTEELARLRRAAALAMGLAKPGDPISYSVPKVGVVGPALDYRSTEGIAVPAQDYDVSVRMVSMHAPHPVIGLTAAVAIAAAATLAGSTVARVMTPQRDPELIRIGTAGGVITARVAPGLASVTLPRAARRLAVAELFVPLGPPETALAS